MYSARTLRIDQPRQRLRLPSARWLLVLAALLMPLRLHAATYHVAPNGDDANPGSRAKPFGTIQKAADVVRPGDTCLLHGGTYRQAATLHHSGQPDKPIRFLAADGETVVLDGTAPISGTWTLHEGNIYKIAIDAPVEQLFVDGAMMIEARWPNMRLDQRYDRVTWRPTTEGSCHGKILDPALAETGIDWTGALITLNVAHQFFSWSRTVESHGQGSDTLTYPKNLPVLTSYAERTKGWEDDYYVLSGKLEALDAPTEWFHDGQTGTLYLYSPDGKNPGDREVAYRVRQHALTGSDLRHVELGGLEFFGCAFKFTNCRDLLVDRCRLRFPTYSRRLTDMEVPATSMPVTTLSGDGNTIRNCVLGYASAKGLTVQGDENLVENCVIHDVCFSGSLHYPALSVGGDRNTVRRCTLFNAGNAVLSFSGHDNRIEYNHVYDGGRLCRDVSLIYTQLPSCSGSVISHNWVHGCLTEGFRGKGHGGMGIRGDDQTRGLTVHHNVVWDVGIHGIIVKGDENRVFNNTVFDVGPQNPAERTEANSKPLLIATRAEPEKPWRKQFPLLEVQNANSLYVNNAVESIVWRDRPLPPSEKISHNVIFGKKPVGNWLKDPAELDFRPREGSELVDAGCLVEGFDGSYAGAAPDVGAYESGGEHWTAGATLSP